MLYSNRLADEILGSYLQDPSLCVDEKYPLRADEFKVEFQKIIFITLHNLVAKGCKTVELIDVNEYLRPHEAQYNIYKDSDGDNYLKTISQIVDKDNFDYYYTEFRKFSCLQDFKDDHCDVSMFYDETKSEESQLKNLAQFTTEDIVNHFEKIAADKRKKYIPNIGSEEMICGSGWAEMVKRFKEEPMLGAGLCSPMLNSLYRGWVRGHLLLRGAPSSFGKTIYGISDLINCSCKKVWSDKENAFIENKSYQGKGAYIHTEQKMAEEIQPRFIATISGVPFHKILDGKFTPEEEARVIEAGRIAEESEIKIINYPTFTGSGLEQMIKDLSINGYEYIVFDYIWNNFYIMGELKEINGGGAIREDQALLHIADVLKLSAEKYNVGIATMIQLNGKEKEVEVVDEGCLFGSKSVKTKLDNGSIFMSPRKKELKQVETLIDKWNFENNKGFNHKIIPNGVSHCFKTRYSRYGQNIKIWHYLDKGTGKMTDMFATTADNMYIDIPKLYIENTKGELNE